MKSITPYGRYPFVLLYTFQGLFYILWRCTYAVSQYVTYVIVSATKAYAEMPWR